MARSARTSTSGWALVLALPLSACSGGVAPGPPSATREPRVQAPAPFPAIGEGEQEGEVGAEGLDLEDVEALVMPEQTTAKATRKVTKWMSKALWTNSAAPAACGCRVTSSR